MRDAAPTLMSRLILALSLLWVGFVAARVAAQPAATEPAGLGPVRCFVTATDAANLDTLSARRLCVGAADVVPAQCFDEASDVLGLSDGEAVTLCRAARSLDPIACANNLDTMAALEDAEIVAYCAAMRWPLIAPPTAGTPACVRAALDQAELTEAEAVRLCRGSADTSPVACYAWGEAQTTVSELDLVELCAPVVVASPYTGASPYPGGAYP